MKNKKILLIGGSGFIGHNLAIKLKQAGAEPIIVDSLSVNNILSFTDSEVENKKLYNSILQNRLDLINKNNIKLIIQDARDYHAVSRIYGEINPDIIIHLAAVSHANKSNKDPHSTFDHSLRTLENTLDFARKDKVHVIYMSSSMVYGDFNSETVNEEKNCKPIGIYGTLKYSGELLVKSYNQIFDLPYTIIRPSALYGERCVSRRVGQIFIENAIQNKEITINGDGSDKLDFTYIEDLVEGIYLCCLKKDSNNQTFNLTFGSSKKINELMEILKSEFPKVKIDYKEREKFMPERGTLDISKAKKLLNYSPSFSIERGYLKYIKWYKDFWAGHQK
ncbi:NAD-dependent epimerase/dehydratase family protein [Candidatus Pelagibacter communis]|uniref:NAD-dependent epimerase/dehydratase family protein n=1 Tax=Pelagibacter ubique TaxID=198252 RepID=UPI00094CFA75|nr:NAD(P)-dependent oxidoreductase [Candidatus Pelagibacter ubique]